MSHLEELEKLADLKAKGQLSGTEYDAQKKKILARNLEVVQAENKYQWAYALLAFLLGVFGIHNFYAGYKGRAIAQLIICLTSPLTLFLALIPLNIWVIVEIFVVKKDGYGRDMVPMPIVSISLGILKIFALIFNVIYVLVTLADIAKAYSNEQNQMAAPIAQTSATIQKPIAGSTEELLFYVDSVVDVYLDEDLHATTNCAQLMEPSGGLSFPNAAACRVVGNGDETLVILRDLSLQKKQDILEKADNASAIGDEIFLFY